METLENLIIEANLQSLKNKGYVISTAEQLVKAPKLKDYTQQQIQAVLDESTKCVDFFQIRAKFNDSKTKLKAKFNGDFEACWEDFKSILNKDLKIEKHPFINEPTYNEDSVVLILGSFPPFNNDEKDYKKFYYGDESNEFWHILGDIFSNFGLKNKPIKDKINFLKKYKIALLDIFEKCVKVPNDNGSISSSDRDIIISKSEKIDFRKFESLFKALQNGKIKRIFTTIGEDSFKLWKIREWIWREYGKFFQCAKNPNDLNEIVIPLYSTSRANSQIGKNFLKVLENYWQIKIALEKFKTKE